MSYGGMDELAEFSLVYDNKSSKFRGIIMWL